MLLPFMLAPVRQIKPRLIAQLDILIAYQAPNIMRIDKPSIAVVSELFLPELDSFLYFCSQHVGLDPLGLGL